MRLTFASLEILAHASQLSHRKLFRLFALKVIIICCIFLNGKFVLHSKLNFFFIVLMLICVFLVEKESLNSSCGDSSLEWDPVWTSQILCDLEDFMFSLICNLNVILESILLFYAARILISPAIYKCMVLPQFIFWFTLFLYYYRICFSYFTHYSICSSS